MTNDPMTPNDPIAIDQMTNDPMTPNDPMTNYPNDLQ